MLSQAVWYPQEQAPWSQRLNSVCPGSHVTAHPRALLLWRLRVTGYIWGWYMSVNHQFQELPLKTSGFFSQELCSKFYDILQKDFYLLYQYKNINLELIPFNWHQILSDVRSQMPGINGMKISRIFLLAFSRTESHLNS